MNKTERSPSKKAVRTAKIRESAGDWITGNFWVRVGLTNSQVRAITRLGRRFVSNAPPCATMVRYLISLSLLNLKETEEKMVGLVRYIEAEDFSSLGCYCDEVMRAQEIPSKKGKAA